MQVTICANGFDWTDIDDCFRQVKREFGLDGAELWFMASMQRPHCTRRDMEDVRPAARRHRIRSLTAHVWGDMAQLGAEDASTELLRWLEACDKTGVEGLIIHGGTHPDPDEGRRQVRLALESVMPRFEEQGVVLNLENVRGAERDNGLQLFSQVWEFEELLAAVNSPSLRVCLDTGHANIAGNLEEFVCEFGWRLNHIHLHGNDGVEDDHLPYPEGTMDWAGLFALLSDQGFDGTFCIEFPVRGRTERVLQCAEEIRARF